MNKTSIKCTRKNQIEMGRKLLKSSEYSKTLSPKAIEKKSSTKNTNIQKLDKWLIQKGVIDNNTSRHEDSSMLTDVGEKNKVSCEDKNETNVASKKSSKVNKEETKQINRNTNTECFNIDSSNLIRPMELRSSPKKIIKSFEKIENRIAFKHENDSMRFEIQQSSFGTKENFKLSNKKCNLDKKYGGILSTIDEVLQENELEEYQNQIKQSFKNLKQCKNIDTGQELKQIKLSAGSRKVSKSFEKNENEIAFKQPEKVSKRKKTQQNVTSTRVTSKSSDKKRTDQKYGVMLPSVNEVLQEKNELEEYQNQINQSLQSLNEKDVEETKQCKNIDTGLESKQVKSRASSRISAKSFEKNEIGIQCKQSENVFKTRRTSKSSNKKNKLDKKYQVMIPSVNEVLQEKKKLEEYRKQINQSFQGLNDIHLEEIKSVQSQLCLRKSAEFQKDQNGIFFIKPENVPKRMHTRRKSSSISSMKSNLKSFVGNDKIKVVTQYLSGKTSDSSSDGTQIDGFEGNDNSSMNLFNNSNQNKAAAAISTENRRKQKASCKPDTQSTLNKFITQKRTKTFSNKTIRKHSSRENCELPSFKICKPRIKENELYKKYGVVLPSVEEVLQEKKELEEYKYKLEAFEGISNTSLEVHFPKKPQMCSEKMGTILDCKNLPLTIISKAVKKNMKYLKGVMSGNIYNDRHERFNNKNKGSFTLSTKDLTYNTSMILFTYDQTEHMLQKLKTYLDPDDKLTQYFFQVLLPELCLLIFKDTYEMGYEEAVTYLDTRPLI